MSSSFILEFFFFFFLKGFHSQQVHKSHRLDLNHSFFFLFTSTIQFQPVQLEFISEPAILFHLWQVSSTSIQFNAIQFNWIESKSLNLILLISIQDITEIIIIERLHRHRHRHRHSHCRHRHHFRRVTVTVTATATA